MSAETFGIDGLRYKIAFISAAEIVLPSTQKYQLTFPSLRQKENVLSLRSLSVLRRKTESFSKKSMTFLTFGSFEQVTINIFSAILGICFPSLILICKQY